MEQTSEQHLTAINARTISDAEPDASHWQFEILSGLHDGAKLELEEGSFVVVGSAPECEIILHDEGVCARHCAIIVHRHSVVLRALDGAVRLNDCLISNDQIDLVGTNQLSLESTGVNISIVQTRVCCTETEHNETTGSAAAQNGFKPVSNVTKIVWMSAIFVLLALVFGAGSMTIADKNQIVENKTPVTSLDKKLAGLNLEDKISVTSLKDKQIIKGILTADEKKRLELALEDSDGRYLINSLTPEQLLEQVSNVFRVNGHAAQLRYLGGAKVQVENLDSNNEQIKKVGQYVEQDVPDLVALSFVEQPAPEPETPEYEFDPEKKMSAIVDGDIAYVSTLDGARYFSGSILPGGYTVKKITNNGVQVIKDGEVMWLYF